MDERLEGLTVEIGWLLTQIRQESKLTQRQAAKILGTGQGQLSDLENGKKDFKISSLLRWADVYGKGVEVYIVDYEEEENADSDEVLSEMRPGVSGGDEGEGSEGGL